MIFRPILVIITILSFLPVLYAKERKPEGFPPAKVKATEIKTGTIAQETEFIGSVYYHEVSDVASEVSGIVESVNFEEGYKIKSGKLLAILNSEILKKTIKSNQAILEQVRYDLDLAKKDLKRHGDLYKNKYIPLQTYDESWFKVKGIEKRVLSLKAQIERLEVELEKKIIKAPFDGVVIKRHIDNGEWISDGDTIATIANDNLLDLIVEVPEYIIKFLKTDMEVQVKVGGNTRKGSIYSIIPKGNISTRTFPVKLRIKDPTGLFESMEGTVSLPSGKKQKSLIVPRDALISKFGRTFVFVILASKAKMIPVKIFGYSKTMVGINGEGLQEGLKVVIKGNERLRDGQEVVVVGK